VETIDEVRAPGRRELKRLATHDALLTAARGLFEEIGYDAATTCAIAGRARVSEATLFRYFPTKADLALATIRERVEALVDALAHRPPTESPYEAVVAVASAPGGRRFVDELMVRDGRRVGAHPELASRLYWLLNETKWRLAEDFGPRLGRDRAAVETRLAADAIVSATILAVEQANRDADPMNAMSWFFEALAVVRPVLERKRDGSGPLREF
jgi:AcrR family transcriptional regulator